VRIATTSRLVDDAGVELTATTGQNTFGIRTGIISDQTKLGYLQEYMCDIARQCMGDNVLTIF
jgi:prophage endopeptidase